MGRERVIVCGGVSVPGIGAGCDTLALNLWQSAGAINVALPVNDIRGKFWKPLSPAFLDLMEIATYVFAADQATTRGGMDVDTFGGSWRRSFALHIPVRELDVWNSGKVKEILCKTLGFLSDDTYDFTFYPAKDAPLLEQYLTLGGGPGPSEPPERVVMFSGGLDSLAGAVVEVVVQKRRVVLVNHRPTPKVNGIHTELERLLAEKAGAFNPMHVPVRINKEKKMGREPSQRSRSFLYMALGAAVARMLGLDSVRFYENGVVSINLPVCEQVIGARATRTTHPRVLQGFEALLTLMAGKPFKVENSFLWETKGEIIQRILKADCGELVGASMSCAHTWEFTLEHPHCGVCSQCIDRRMAVIAAGAEQFDPQDNYDLDIFTESIPKPEDRIMVAEYVEQANKFRTIKDTGQLFSDYSEVAGVLRYLDRDAASGATMILELYRRHAAEVRKAINMMLARHADDLLARSLPGDCLLRIVSESNLVTSLPAGPADGEKPAGGMQPVAQGSTTKILEGIHQEIIAGRVENREGFEMVGRGVEAVAKGNYELRKAKERLEKMLADGFFAFTKRVDARAFKVICTILAAGDVAKASRDLEMKDSTLREEIKAWKGRGETYEIMLGLVGWRKTVGKRVEIPFNDSVLLEKTDAVDHPALFSDVLDGLLSMTDGNWAEKAEELSELLRPHVPR